MAAATFEVGSRVSITNYSPFRGLKGTIKQTHVISDPEDEELFCFYYVELDGTQLKRPMWFQSNEVASLGASPALFAG